MPTSAARAEARALLANPQLFRLTEGLPDDRTFDSWAPELRDVLGRYQKIECRTGDANISRGDIRPFDDRGDRMIIGRNEHASVVVKPSEDTVYEFNAKGQAPPWLHAPLQTIWHWILWVDFVNDADPTSSVGP